MRKKPTNLQKILKALQNGPKTQADLLKETRVKNTYQIVADLVKKGQATRDGRLVKLSGAPETKVTAQPANKPKVVPNELAEQLRSAMLKDEIDNINDGIRSLMITRSYLLRRAQEESADA
jgi:hypothetical protein